MSQNEIWFPHYRVGNSEVLDIALYPTKSDILQDYFHLKITSFFGDIQRSIFDQPHEFLWALNREIVY